MCTLDKKKKAYKLLIYKDSCCNYMNQVVVIFMLHIYYLHSPVTYASTDTESIVCLDFFSFFRTKNEIK